MTIFPVRFYDIYVYTILWYFIVDVIFFYYCSLYFFLPQNPDIIIIMRRGSRVTRKIFEIDLFVFRFGMLHIIYIYHVLLFYQFYHERWPLVWQWRYAIAASVCSKYTGVHTTKNQIKQFYVLYNIRILFTLRLRVVRSHVLVYLFIR